MFPIREARLSIWYELKLLFESAAVWGTAFTVYGKDDMRSSVALLTRPFVFLLDSRILFETEHLPVVVIEAEFDTEDFELGNSKGFCHFQLHVFGRSRGERDDISGGIVANLTSVRIRDFDTAGYPVQSTEQLEVDGQGRYWTVMHPDISTEVAIEGTLANWDILSSQFWVTLS